MEAVNDGLTITCGQDDPDRVLEVLSVPAVPPADALALAATVKAKQGNKYDSWLDESLLDEDYAARALDTPTAHAAVVRMLAEVDSAGIASDG